MLTSKQRAYLRGLANNYETLFQVGKGGINDNIIQSADQALEARELIKLSVLDTSEFSAKEAANIIAQGCNADVVSVVGKRFVLYRESKTKKKIDLI